MRKSIPSQFCMNLMNVNYGSVCLLRTAASCTFSCQMEVTYPAAFSVTSLECNKQGMVYLYICLPINTSLSLCKAWETIYLSSEVTWVNTFPCFGSICWARNFWIEPWKMNPAGAIWQNELSREVLNHTPSREKGAGPEITRSLCQDSMPCTSFFFRSNNCVCFRKDPWWTQMAPPDKCYFCEVLCGDHKFPAYCICPARADTSLCPGEGLGPTSKSSG